MEAIPSERVKSACTSLAGAAILSFLCYGTGRSVITRIRETEPGGPVLLVARASSPALLYSGALAVGLGVFAAVLRFLNYSGLNQDLLTGSCLALLILGTVMVFWGAFQLRISARELEYWSLETGHLMLTLEEIERARIRIGLSSKPGIRLEIIPKSTGRVPIFVAIKAFRAEDMRRVFDWLGPKLEDHKGLKPAPV
jgi:hypothetical protein